MRSMHPSLFRRYRSNFSASNAINFLKLAGDFAGDTFCVYVALFFFDHKDLDVEIPFLAHSI